MAMTQVDSLIKILTDYRDLLNEKIELEEERLELERRIKKIVKRNEDNIEKAILDWASKAWFFFDKEFKTYKFYGIYVGLGYTCKAFKDNVGIDQFSKSTAQIEQSSAGSIRHYVDRLFLNLGKRYKEINCLSDEEKSMKDDELILSLSRLVESKKKTTKPKETSC